MEGGFNFAALVPINSYVSNGPGGPFYRSANAFELPSSGRFDVLALPVVLTSLFDLRISSAFAALFLAAS